MTSHRKLPAEPVGIELLLEMLNASQGLVARDASPPEVPAEPELWPPVTAEVQSPEAVEGMSFDAGVEVPAGNPDVEVGRVISDVEGPVEIPDEIENRFAAHIVRGMSKSKTG
jgi:hypothetical protein